VGKGKGRKVAKKKIKKKKRKKKKRERRGRKLSELGKQNHPWAQRGSI
jgi:hypothetical protein